MTDSYPCLWGFLWLWKNVSQVLNLGLVQYHTCDSNVGKECGIGLSLRVISGLTLTLLLVSMLHVVFNVQVVVATGTIYIRADGSIDPPTVGNNLTNNWGGILMMCGFVRVFFSFGLFGLPFHAF